MNNFIQSIKKNYKGIFLMVIAALLTSVGQLFWKISEGTKVQPLFFGFLLYGIGAVLMILAFRYGSLSVIHPMLSFGYIFALILGYFVLKENITINQYLGIIAIIVGVVLIGGGDE